MQIAFDPVKDEANRRKHGASLAEGREVFGDPRHLVLGTVREADGEERLKAIGLRGDRLWTVVFVRRGEALRFISVRKSNAKEARAYSS